MEYITRDETCVQQIGNAATNVDNDSDADDDNNDDNDSNSGENANNDIQ